MTDDRAALAAHGPLPRFGTDYIDCRCGWNAPRPGVIVWWVTHAEPALLALPPDPKRLATALHLASGCKSWPAHRPHPEHEEMALVVVAMWPER